MISRILGLLGVAVLVLSGCGGAIDAADEEEGPVDSAGEALSGASLYAYGTFGGNGRTCATCHPIGTGTISPADAKAIYAWAPNDPLFRATDSDDGTGSSYHRLLTYATVNVDIPLAANVKLASDPSATSVRFERGIPTTLDTPALDPVLMYDGRADTLLQQATGAILGHAQAPKVPGQKDLDKIIDYESKLFSSPALKNYANGGAVPVLPTPVTAAEKRGAKWFDSSVASAVCAHCHSGPMLNEANQFNVFGLPVGTRFITAFVSELNPRNLPSKTFIFTNPDASKTVVTSPDPGRALITGKVSDVNFFKTKTLWNVKNTAPYFHDCSAKNFDELMTHYNNFFVTFTKGTLTLSWQDQRDIIAYLKLL